MNFPCQGHWWLPGSPDKSIFGTLTFTRREGATLSLADALPGTGDEPQTDVVLGQTAGGAHVTLLHAIRTAAPLLRLTPAFPCSYHAPLLITGGAFESQADMRFSLFQIRFPELKPWAGKHGFEIDASELFAGRECPAVRINYRTPPRQVLLRDTDGLGISLGFFPLLRNERERATVRQDVYVEFQQASRDTLEDYMQTATRFEHLLTLATGSLVRAGSIKAVVRTEEADAKSRSIIVDIFYQPVRNARRRNALTDEFLFTLPDIAGREEECFRNWFTKADWLDPVSALYFGTLYNPSKYLDFNFLALVQAVEAYHRRASDDSLQRGFARLIWRSAHVDGRDVAPHDHASMVPARRDLQMPKPPPLT